MVAQIFFFFFFPSFIFSLSLERAFFDSTCFESCQSNLQEDPCLISVFRLSDGMNFTGTASISTLTNRLTVDLINGFADIDATNPDRVFLRGRFVQNSTSGNTRSKLFRNDTSGIFISDSELVFVDFNNSYQPITSLALDQQGVIFTLSFDENSIYALQIFQIELFNLTNISSIPNSTNFPLPGQMGNDITRFMDESGVGYVVFTSESTTRGGGSVSILQIDPLNPFGLQLGTNNNLPAPFDVDAAKTGDFILVAGSSTITLFDSRDVNNLQRLDQISESFVFTDVDFFPLTNPTRVVAFSESFISVWAIDNGRNLEKVIDFNASNFLFFSEFLAELTDLQVSLDGHFIYAPSRRHGFLTYCTGTLFSRNPSETDNVGLIVGLTISFFFIFLFLFCLCGICGFLFWRGKRREEQNEEFEMNTVEYKQKKEYTFSEIQQLDDIKILEALGKGRFGIVYKAKWNGVTVALKYLGSDDIEKIKQEAKILKNLDHPHIIHLFGFTSKDMEGMAKIYLVFEFMSKGDLQNLLLKDSHISEKQLSDMSEQTALGMEYLHSKGVIHRDLACRNILVSGDSQLLIKIADFGLSRQSDDYYSSKSTEIPIRWTSPEALEFRKFSQSSDIWSYGITIWEIFSRGAVPYSALTNIEVVEKLKEGFRLNVPKLCPEPLAIIMKQCWEEDPTKRPSWKDIRSVFLKERENENVNLDTPIFQNSRNLNYSSEDTEKIYHGSHNGTSNHPSDSSLYH